MPRVKKEKKVVVDEKTPVQKVVEFVTNKWPNKVCEICHHNEWQANDKFSFITTSVAATQDNEHIPIQIICCKNCFNTKLFCVNPILLMSQSVTVEVQE